MQLYFCLTNLALRCSLRQNRYMKKLGFLSLILLSGYAGAQNVGIGTNNPQTKLDINGALSARITSVAASASVTIPDNVTLFRLTNTTGGSTTNLTLANPKDGQFLSVINEDDNAAVLNGITIPAGTAAIPTVANFINIGGVAAGWKTTGDNNVGANTFTAGNGLSWTGNTLNSVWTVNGQNDIYNNNSSGNVGIGNNAPGGLLDVSATAPANNSAGKSIILLAQNGGTGGAATNGGNVSIASGTGANGGSTGTVNINTSNTNTGAINVANGSATQTVGIANNNSGVKTVTIGSTNTTSTTTINAGSGNLNLNGNTILTGTQTVSGLSSLNGGLTETGTANINNNAGTSTTNIGTGTTTGNVSIGGAGNNVLLPKLTTAGIVTNTATGQLGTTTTVPAGNLPDATTSTKGIVQLTGDLSGTAASPQIAAGTIVDADVNSAAAITRSKLANGTANQVVINDGSGVLSSEAQLAVTRGGTGASTAAAHTFFGNNTNGTAAPGFQSITAGDLPNLNGTYVDLSTNQTAGGVKTWSADAKFTSSTASTSTTTGAVVVTGGQGVGGNQNIGGTQTVTGLTTLNGGLTETGTASINNNAGTNTTSIGTGTTTGNVTIGGASNNVLLPKLGTAGGVVYASTAGGQLAVTNNAGTATVLHGGNGGAPTFSAIVAGDISGLITANNGLNMSTGTNVQLGGPLVAATTISSAAAGNNLTINSTVAASTTANAETVGHLVINRSNSGGMGGQLTLRNSVGATNSAAALAFELDGSTAFDAAGADAANAQIKAQITTAGNGASLIFSNWSGSANSERMRIQHDGNVGIGTTGPTLKLDVLETSATNSIAVLRRGTQGSDASMVTAYGAPYLKIGGVEYKTNSIQSIGFGWNSNSIQPAEIGFLTTNTAGNTSGDLVFATRNGTSNVAPTEAMRITSLGNVGIGTAPATYKLEVNGGIRSADYGAAGSVNVLIGDDVFLSDMDEAHTLGVLSATNAAMGRIRLGNLSNVVRVTDDQTGDFGGVATFDFDDADATTQGVLVEGGTSESGGFFANGNTAAIWSPGDGSGGVFSVYDEDDMVLANARLRVNNSGETEARYGMRTRKAYTYFRGRANEDQAYTYSLGSFDLCYLGGVSFYMDNATTWDIDNQCNVYPTDWGSGVWGDGGNSNQLYTTGPIYYNYNARPSWQMYVESYIDNDAVYCGAICVNFSY